MIDIVQLLVKAGDGGHGWVSFRREKFVTKGGPDGGDGGDGGNVIVRANKNLATLAHFAGIRQVEAKNGQTGAKKKMIGRSAEDVVIEVPIGTLIWQIAGRHVQRRNTKKRYFLEKETEPIPPQPDFEEPLEQPPLRPHAFSKKEAGPDKHLLVRLEQDGQELVLCRGGWGGKGNTAFKSSVKTTPLEAEYGTFGQERLVVLELELLADVGLVGLPNAGKSTFLSKVTKAQPKIANYPFTTLEPHLGIWHLGAIAGAEASTLEQDLSVVVADIPGLIEGASQGKGLGHDFLRHVKNCRVLLFLLYLPEEVIFDESVSVSEKAEQVWQQYQLLESELAQYNRLLSDKPRIVALNKIDIYPEELRTAIQKVFKKNGKTSQVKQLVTLSGFTGQNIAELATEVGSLVREKAQ